MGIFDFFKKKEEKKEVEKIVVKAAITGKAINISEVPDPTFAEKLLGDGIGIVPVSSGEIVAPVSGTIVQLFETLHAFTIETESGVNVLVHFGLNTVELKGEGFIKLLNEGDKVKAGDAIVKYDLDFIKENAPSVITPMVILDSEEYKSIKVSVDKDVVAGQDIVIEIEK